MSTSDTTDIADIAPVRVFFLGGPWDLRSVELNRVTSPVFAADDIGKHYYLNLTSDPPTYVWISHDPTVSDVD